MYKITSIRGNEVVERQAIAVLEDNFEFQLSVFAPPLKSLIVAGTSRLSSFKNSTSHSHA